ncbi:uncharacterized protein LOC107855791 isoform X2 [Capsicum annuum]|uniref:uncharacterized protein LOC107855791 isoform X2 n=1 Tax=Capsicum annuum TaxID=4072 RepID=UPI0007BFC019|nr:uncharacterized protein LOC107855791 isoform X2 [Capsicum annuum]
MLPREVKGEINMNQILLKFEIPQQSQDASTWLLPEFVISLLSLVGHPWSSSSKSIDHPFHTSIYTVPRCLGFGHCYVALKELIVALLSILPPLQTTT